MLKTTLGIEKAVLLTLGEERLLDFAALRAAGRWHSAVYMAGYAVEAFLKCCICRRLDCDKMPKIYEVHELGVLLFYAGLERELSGATNAALLAAFQEIDKLWKDGSIRYTDPAVSKYNAQTCGGLDLWMNDPIVGVVPWLKSRI